MFWKAFPFSHHHSLLLSSVWVRIENTSVLPMYNSQKPGIEKKEAVRNKEKERAGAGVQHWKTQMSFPESRTLSV